MKPLLAVVFWSVLLVSSANTRALTVEELRASPNLTPEKFSSLFANFKFVFRANVQKPAEFLASQSGDCDDFSTLAAAELAARGYSPRLIAVRMKKEVHVVCYIDEARGYLDYNLRAKGGLVPCRADLAQIADSVAKSFKCGPWTSVSEFTYSANVKRLVKTTLPKDHLTASAPLIAARN